MGSTEDEWTQELQAVSPHVSQEVRWHGASISLSPACMQQQTLAPFRSHSATDTSHSHNVQVQESPSFDLARHSSSVQHHAVLGHAHAWPLVPLHPHLYGDRAIGMMNYWHHGNFGFPRSSDLNLMQYQNPRDSSETFMQDVAAQNANVGMTMNADAQNPTMCMQEMAGRHYNVTPSAYVEGAHGNTQRMRMLENTIATSMKTDLLAKTPAPQLQAIPIRAHDVVMRHPEEAAKWASYFHPQDMEQVVHAPEQGAQANASVAPASGSRPLMLMREECGRPSMRYSERKVKHPSGKDRHSKVKTARGMRDRRVRLSVSTATQFYDIQDRLGFQQPSRVFEWLMQKAKHAIDQLPASPWDHQPTTEANSPATGAAAAASFDHHGHIHGASLNHPHTSMQEAAARKDQPPVVAAPAPCSILGDQNTQSKLGSLVDNPSSVAFTGSRSDHQE